MAFGGKFPKSPMPIGSTVSVALMVAGKMSWPAPRGGRILRLLVEKAETLERAGEEDREGEVRWTGFRATGGGAFLEELDVVVEDERRRSICLVAGMGDEEWRSEVCEGFLLSAKTEGEGWNGGGSLRGPFWRADEV